VLSGAVPSLRLVAINSRHSLDRLLVSTLNYTGLVFQDSRQLGLAARLGALNDDLLVYDR